MQILKTKNECDHVQFLITEQSGPGVVPKPMIADLECLSLGKFYFLSTYTIFSKREINKKKRSSIKVS